jgi:hypothetical protein
MKRSQYRLLNPPATLPDHFDRFHSIEASINQWLSISIATMVAGILVHLNLHYIIGVCIIIDGIIIAGLTLLGAAFWMNLGEFELEKFMEYRRGLLIVKYFFIVVLGGLAIWTSVDMIQRSV